MDKTQITLSDSEKNAINRIRAEMDQARSNLANASFQAYQAERIRDQAAESLVQVNKRLEERIGDIAKDHGVDLTDANAGKWSFDLDKLELRRVDSPTAPVPAPIPLHPTPAPSQDKPKGKKG